MDDQESSRMEFLKTTRYSERKGLTSVKAHPVYVKIFHKNNKI